MRTMDARLGALSLAATLFFACGHGRTPGARDGMSANANASSYASWKNSQGAAIGLTPSEIRDAYGIPDSRQDSKSVPVIGIVVQGDNPNAERDLASYRKAFSLPECSTENGCLTFVNAKGGRELPRPDDEISPWPMEITLDLDAASAVCSWCRLLVVEADPETKDPGASTSKYAAIATAARLGASVISNSWMDVNALEDTRVNVDVLLKNIGVGVFFASGELGYCEPPCLPHSGHSALPYPASSPFAWAVGGTTLKRSTGVGPASRRWVESVWNEPPRGVTGCACNTKAAKPSWQTSGICSGRAANDVAAVANFENGLVTYDTYKSRDPSKPWKVQGGTSLATIVVASIFALTGNGRATPDFAYTHRDYFFDVDTGQSNPCDGSPMCKAGKGWDGPTGNGSPNAARMLVAPADPLRPAPDAGPARKAAL